MKDVPIVDGWSPGVPNRVAVVCEQSLIAEAVRIALRSRGFDVVVVREPTLLAAAAELAPHGGPDTATPAQADLGLLISDLDSVFKVRWARAVLRSSPNRWLVVTGAALGPAWGAVLDAGADRVLPSSASLDEIDEALGGLAVGAVTGHGTRAALVAQWVAERARWVELAERLGSLTPREREVLQHLYRGDTVVKIARSLGVAPATVRSQVKAVLRKLRVSSQLAAVSMLQTVGDDPLDGDELWVRTDPW